MEQWQPGGGLIMNHPVYGHLGDTNECNDYKKLAGAGSKLHFPEMAARMLVPYGQVKLPQPQGGRGSQKAEICNLLKNRFLS